MRTSIGATALALAVAATPAFAHEASFDDFKQFCKAIEGRWVGDVTWITSWPGLGNKGDKVKAYYEARVSEDGHLLIGKFFGGSGSETMFAYHDARTQSIYWTGVDSGGSVSRGKVYREGGNWVYENKVALKDGAKGKTRNVGHITNGGKTWTWSHEGKIGNDVIKEQADVWQRVNTKG